MRGPIEAIVIYRQIRKLAKFVKDYFADNLSRVILYGSFLNFFAFKKYSDVDIVIVLHENNFDEPFFKERLRQFRINHNVRRIFDIRILTEDNLRQLKAKEVYQKLIRGGSVIDDINGGWHIFRSLA